MYGFDHITDMSGWDIFMVMTFTIIIGVVFTILWDKIKDNIGTNKIRRLQVLLWITNMKKRN